MSQNIESRGQRMIPTLGFFLDRLWISLTGVAFWVIGGIFLAIFTPFWDNAKAVWQTPSKIDQLQADVQSLRTDLTIVTGDNRVIRQSPGLSYVTEPVRIGDPVILNLVMQRTELGESCIFITGQSLFTEAGGVMTPGSEIHPSRQIGDAQVRMRIHLTAPQTLNPGRIELYLALEYNCDGKRVFDRTDVVTYNLLPAKSEG